MMDKRLMAGVVVAIVLLAAIGAYTYKPGPSGAKAAPMPERPMWPYVDNVTNQYNFPLSIGSRPAAEPHVAINPRDPDNMVASSNDMNNPSQDTWLHFYTTKDGGKSWSPARPTPHPNPNSGIDAVRLVDGRVVLVHNDTPSGRTPLNVSLSADLGETWKGAVVLENDPGE